MTKLLLRWILPTSALLFFGPLVAIPVESLRDGNGDPQTTLLTSATPVLGVLALVLVTLVAGAGGAITGRLTAAGTGRTFAGLTIVWVAIRTGSSWEILTTHGGGAIMALIIEGVLVAIAGGILLVMLAAGDGTRDVRALKEDFAKAVSGSSALIGMLVGVIAGGTGAFLVAVDGGRGQCLMAGILASVLCAVGTQLSAVDLHPEQARIRASVAVLALMVLSPISLLFMPGSDNVAEAARMGTLFGPGLVQPLDWLAGIFLGVPTGMAWVGSVSERAQQSVAARPVRL